jgi:hypothetical protein
LRSADRDVGLAADDVEASDGADQLEVDPGMTLVDCLECWEDVVPPEDLGRGDPHAAGKLTVGA